MAKTKTVKLKHSITHDGIEYSPGIHELDAETAEHFLGLKAPHRVEGNQPVAVLPELKTEAPVAGTTKPAADAKPPADGGKEPPDGEKNKK